MPTSTTPTPTSPLLAPFTTPTFSAITYLNSTLPSLPPITPTPNSTPNTPSQSNPPTPPLRPRNPLLPNPIPNLNPQRPNRPALHNPHRAHGRYPPVLLPARREGDGDGGLGKAVRGLMPPASPTSAQEGALQPKIDAQTPIIALSRDIVGGEEGGGEGDGARKALSQLRTLLHVRALLTSTTQTFNAALSFLHPPLPAPTPPTNHPQEEEALQSMHQELEALAAGEDGEQRAKERIRELREVVRVWKGTGEEKVRGRVVDVLEGVVERRREEESLRSQGLGQGRRPAVVETRAQDAGGGGGRGFLEGLQRLRGEMGMD
ncbi:hypothetical protein G7Y79_00074g098940 [Physcia stellaris]|nr:hypothetical protein G7Y79_00074g098940 [Physcia stellaris]